jgi:hypothetical protein
VCVCLLLGHTLARVALHFKLPAVLGSSKLGITAPTHISKAVLISSIQLPWEW